MPRKRSVDMPRVQRIPKQAHPHIDGTTSSEELGRARRPRRQHIDEALLYHDIDSTSTTQPNQTSRNLSVSQAENTRSLSHSSTGLIRVKHDPEAPAAKCLSCWPTDPTCLIMYIQAFISIVCIIVSLVVVTTYPKLGLDKEDTCSFFALLSAILAYWIRSPLSVYKRDPQ